MWPWSTKDRFIPSEEILLKAQGREVDGLRRNELGKEEVSPGRRGLLHGGRVVTEGQSMARPGPSTDTAWLEQSVQGNN